MRTTVIVLSIVGLFGYACAFRPYLGYRITTRLSVVMPDDTQMDGKNWWQQLVQAFIQAIPEVMRPPKEMDPSKVVYDPPAFEKPSTSDSKKMYRKRMDAIDHFLERYETESVVVETRTIVVESVPYATILESKTTTFEPKSQVFESKSSVMEPKSNSQVAKVKVTEKVIELKAEVFMPKSQVSEMRSTGTPKMEKVEKKKYFYNKNNMKKTDTPDQMYGKPSTTVGEPRTIYWPLKKDIIHHGNPARSMQKPHDLNTSLL